MTLTCHLALQKSNKTNADLDLPPHLANKPATSSQATLSKPSTSHQPSMSRPSSKANVVPIPISDQTQPSSSSKSKKPYDQSAGKGEARPDDGEPSASSRNTTPSRKGKQQRSQEGQSKVPNAKPDTFASPAVVRKVVPIKLDRTPRPADSQAGPSHGATGSGQSSSQAQQPETRNGAQVLLKSASLNVAFCILVAQTPLKCCCQQHTHVLILQSICITAETDTITRFVSKQCQTQASHWPTCHLSEIALSQALCNPCGHKVCTSEQTHAVDEVSEHMLNCLLSCGTT